MRCQTKTNQSTAVFSCILVKLTKLQPRPGVTATIVPSVRSRSCRRRAQSTVICQFYEGSALFTINSEAMLGKMVDDAGVLKFQCVGTGHHGHILSQVVKSRVRPLLSSSQPHHGAASARPMAMDVSDTLAEKPEKKRRLPRMRRCWPLFEI